MPLLAALCFLHALVSPSLFLFLCGAICGAGHDIVFGAVQIGGGTKYCGIASAGAPCGVFM
ncbi:hypothetical protein HF325_004660 [Metschnikowia pulcherrima]|uniref:Uncharacterized protein n=1 Tax=Metschnikowia pulcherrima TaxID=27326 RepID=A0A8H7GQN2_9ASCO|nr:hypothetical protein HF325_004660 [Metschnikowia pulcherrima]